ncbi:MAG: tetratricopeptide repeat protein [Treponema sp.]|nr:tetratricopeptide repeat protein [Treponema sp.]
MKKTNLFFAVIFGVSLILNIMSGCASKPQAETDGAKKEAPTDKKGESKKEPEDPPNVKFVKKLQAKLDQDDVKGAIACFETIPASLKDDTELMILLGSLYISDANYDEAINTANQVLTLEPGKMEAMELISIAQRAKGDRKSYKATLDQILAEDPFNVNANIQKAEDYALNRKWKLARDCYRKALKSDKKNMDARIGFAQMSYYCDDVDLAKEFFQQITEEDADNATAYAYLAKISMEEENYLKASMYSKKAIESDPKNYDYWIDYGNIIRYLGKFDEAIEAWKKAISLDPTYFLGYAYCAGLYDEQNKYDQALENYLKVIETNPNYYYAYEEIAILCYHLKKYEDAIKFFNKTYEYSNSYAYKLMASACYTKLGDKLKAKNTLSPVLKTLEKDSPEYYLVRFWYESYSKNAESSLINRISKEENGNKRGKMLFYMGLYYELNNFEEMANDYYAKVTSMQAPMFFEYRIAEWGLLK